MDDDAGFGLGCAEVVADVGFEFEDSFICCCCCCCRAGRVDGAEELCDSSEISCPPCDSRSDDGLHPVEKGIVDGTELASPSFPKYQTDDSSVFVREPMRFG